MLTLSNDFCLFIEKADEAPKQALLTYLQRVLPLIYLKSALIPDIETGDEDAVEHYVTEEVYEDIFNTLRSQLGADDEFLYLDPIEHSPTDPVKGSIAENIADIYQDLKDFVLLYQKPLTPFKENAVRECRRLFGEHYGFRITAALTAIHNLLYASGVGDNPEGYDLF